MNIFIFPFISIASCGTNQFQCKKGVCKHHDASPSDCYGPCIRIDWVNNNVADCTDESDEGEWLNYILPNVFTN